MDFGGDEPAHRAEREAKGKDKGEDRADPDPGFDGLRGPVVRVLACDSTG